MVKRHVNIPVSFRIPPIPNTIAAEAGQPENTAFENPFAELFFPMQRPACYCVSKLTEDQAEEIGETWKQAFIEHCRTYDPEKKDEESE